jgi:hypothetical protein
MKAHWGTAIGVGGDAAYQEFADGSNHHRHLHAREGEGDDGIPRGAVHLGCLANPGCGQLWHRLVLGVCNIPGFKLL